MSNVCDWSCVSQFRLFISFTAVYDSNVLLNYQLLQFAFLQFIQYVIYIFDFCNIFTFLAYKYCYITSMWKSSQKTLNSHLSQTLLALNDYNRSNETSHKVLGYFTTLLVLVHNLEGPSVLSYSVVTSLARSHTDASCRLVAHRRGDRVRPILEAPLIFRCAVSLMGLILYRQTTLEKVVFLI